MINTKLLRVNQCPLLRYISNVPNIQCVPKTVDENTTSNKNMLLYKYAKESKSNKNLLLLPDAFNYWMKVPEEKLDIIKASADYLLHAIILIDDVQDGTRYRRNLPSANRIFGAPWSLTSSLYCHFVSLKIMNKLHSPEALEVFCEEYLSALDGISLDLYWRDTFLCPTEEEYKAMAMKKTGALFVMTFRLMQSVCSHRADLQQLSETLGVYYQIRDEYTNLVNVKALDGKSHQHELKDLHNLMFCEDITEGRFSWPVIHGLRSSEGPTIRSILVQRTADVRLKQHCLDLLEKAGSLEYTRQTLLQLDTDLRDQIQQLGGNPHLIAFLDENVLWKR